MRKITSADGTGTSPDSQKPTVESPSLSEITTQRSTVFGDSKDAAELRTASLETRPQRTPNAGPTPCAPRQPAALVCVLEVQGGLQTPLGSGLGARVEAALRRGYRQILLDLSGLLAIDAAGIGELIQAYNMTTAAGGVLRIVGANGRVRRLLEIAGVFELLTVGGMREQTKGVSNDHGTVDRAHRHSGFLSAWPAAWE